jgi:anti-sigma B factor antagonist
MSAGSTRRIEVQEQGDVTIARFIDKKILDETNIQIIGNQLVALVEEDDRKKIILDFSAVEYLSSAALSKLLILDKKAKAAGAKLRLCSIRPDILQIFTLTKLNKLFDIRVTEEDALEGL